MPGNCKTILIGSEGFLGRHFYRAYSQMPQFLFATQYKTPHAPYHFDLQKTRLSDLPIPECCTHAIITASCGDVIFCEQNPELSSSVNVTHTLALAKELTQLGITPILFSSTYVYDGSKGHYREEDPVCPVNEYGKQKAVLEAQIEEICDGNYLLMRLGKIFSFEMSESSLFSETLREILEKKPIRAANDMIFAPLLVDELIRISQALQEKHAKGLYNVCGADVLSRWDYVQLMVEKFQGDPNLIQKISLDSISYPIQIPKRNDLVCDKLRNFGISPQKPLDQLVDCYLSHQNATQKALSPSWYD